MKEMVTGENFKRVCWNKNKVIPVKPEVKAEIKKLQKMDSDLWNNESLDDEFVEKESKKINARINKLIDDN
jgi:hypothetical protein